MSKQSRKSRRKADKDMWKDEIWTWSQLFAWVIIALSVAVIVFTLALLITGGL